MKADDPSFRAVALTATRATAEDGPVGETVKMRYADAVEALATAVQQSGPGHQPVDWLVNWATRQPVPRAGERHLASGEDLLPAGERDMFAGRGVSLSMPSRSTTNVIGSASSAAG
jgi:hypothetical protein